MATDDSYLIAKIFFVAEIRIWLEFLLVSLTAFVRTLLLFSAAFLLLNKQKYQDNFK